MNVYAKKLPAILKNKKLSPLEEQKKKMKRNFSIKQKENSFIIWEEAEKISKRIDSGTSASTVRNTTGRLILYEGDKLF